LDPWVEADKTEKAVASRLLEAKAWCFDMTEGEQIAETVKWKGAGRKEVLAVDHRDIWHRDAAAVAVAARGSQEDRHSCWSVAAVEVLDRTLVGLQALLDHRWM
jgi:BioD-like phosphotransacetylase family protein